MNSLGIPEPALCAFGWLLRLVSPLCCSRWLACCAADAGWPAGLQTLVGLLGSRRTRTYQRFFDFYGDNPAVDWRFPRSIGDSGTSCGDR